jgi:hypothetical protein
VNERYEPPKIERLGSLHDMTRQLNKVGPTPDQFSATTGIVGSIGPIAP